MGDLFDYEGFEERVKDKDREKIRKVRLESMRREKEKQLTRRRLIKKYGIYIGLAVVVFIIIIFWVVNRLSYNNTDEKPDNEKNEVVTQETLPSDTEIETESTQEFSVEESKEEPENNQPRYSARLTDYTKSPSDEIISDHVIFIEKSTGDILSQKDCNERINPASMTKILTVLVAAENVNSLDDTFTITRDITDYCFVHDCSNVGWDVDETVTVRDLFYGTILPSGADAAVGLAMYIAGSHESFVELMNEKLQELGLSESTHFTNCVGIYDKEHYSTVYDMAMILEAALDNDICREVMSAHTYNTSATQQHPEGITISNWFLRRIEDKDTGGEVICAKTGFVAQSKSCAASYGKDKMGNEFICVTTGSSSSWKCIYDHVSMYKQFASE